MSDDCTHDFMPFGTSLACRKCGDPIRAQNSACEADYPTELRKMAVLVDRVGLGHTAEMLRGAANEIDRLRPPVKPWEPPTDDFYDTRKPTLYELSKRKTP